MSFFSTFSGTRMAYKRTEHCVDVYDDLTLESPTLVDTFFHKGTEYEGKQLFKAYAEHYRIFKTTMEKSGAPCEYIEIDMNNRGIYTTKPGYLGCVVDATTALMGSFHGRQLHSTDKEWAAWHPYATKGGVPAPHTPTFMQDLLEPYGFGVSRVAVYPESIYADETDLDRWKQALGINPMGAADRKTSNVDFCILTGMPFDVAEQLFRFEYRVTPLAAAVVGECGWSGVGTGYQGGHAVYRPPRGHFGHWEFSVQVQPLDRIKYLDEVPTTAHMPRRPGDLNIDFKAISAPDGSVIDGTNVVWNGYQSRLAPNRPVVKALTSVTGPINPDGQAQTNLFPDYEPKHTRLDDTVTAPVETPLALLDAGGLTDEEAAYYNSFNPTAPSPAPHRQGTSMADLSNLADAYGWD